MRQRRSQPVSRMVSGLSACLPSRTPLAFRPTADDGPISTASLGASSKTLALCSQASNGLWESSDREVHTFSRLRAPGKTWSQVCFAFTIRRCSEHGQARSNTVRTNQLLHCQYALSSSQTLVFQPHGQRRPVTPVPVEIRRTS